MVSIGEKDRDKSSLNMKMEHEAILKLSDHKQVYNESKLFTTFYFNVMTASSLTIGMEKCVCDLFHLLESVVQLNLYEIGFYGLELALALHHIHSLNIIHRDVKLENIFIGTDGHLRLGDFGSCMLLDNKDDLIITSCGTLLYSSPQVLLREYHSYDADWWSFGLILYEMFFINHPFYDEDDSIICDNIVNEQMHSSLLQLKVDPTNYVNDISETNNSCTLLNDFSDLLLGTIQYDRTNRYNNKDVLLHSFFKHTIHDDDTKIETIEQLFQYYETTISKNEPPIKLSN